jgi:drug/metabolite transporter (DMT)-like permease
MLSSRFPAISLSVGSMISGLILLTPFTLAELAAAGTPKFTMMSAGILIYLGLGASALTFFLWNYALQSIQASHAAPFMNLIPVVGLAASLLAGESLSGWQWAGGVLALSGVWLNSYFARQKS